MILASIDPAPLVTVVGLFGAPEKWLNCFTTKSMIAGAATRKRRAEARAEEEETAFDVPRAGAGSMSKNKVRPEVDLLSGFALTITGTFAIALPMAVAIIWVCS